MPRRAAEKEGERKGDFLGGKYLLEDCLGIGGMGEGYRAQNVSLGRKVAIKLLNREHTGNEDDVMRFLREARAAAAVRHPNVVDVFDVARDDDGTPFIVQELLSGQDLEQYLGASGGVLGAEEALEIMIPVADAVAAAHTQNVVHRDLKPANIFLAREGTKIIPKVLDFGACLYQTVGALSAKEQRMLIGTPHYMAPEQITTAMEVDARADVWAMGVILYELLVGETPFEAEDGSAVMKLVRTRAVPRLRKVAPNAPASLEDLVGRCLDRDRRKRFADAAAVRVELERIRKELRPERRKNVDSDPDLVDFTLPVIGERAAQAPRKADDEPPSYRIPSLVLKGGKTPTKRRGSSLLTLSSPDEPVAWDSDPPKSASRPIEAARPARIDPRSEPEPPSKPARTAADVIREAEAAAAAGTGAVSPSRPPQGPSSVPPAPPSRPRELGAPRELDLDAASDPALSLDIEPPSSRAPRTHDSSIPPVLDPRAAAPKLLSDRPPVSVPSPLSDRSARASRTDDAALTPPIAAARAPRTPVPPAPTSGATWSASATGSLVATIAVPAAAAFFALRFAPFVTEPLRHAMRGDSPLASGVLAVLMLVIAAALATRALGSSRSPGMLIATIGAVATSIVMIIVTFSASETAELEIPPAAGGIVPFIAPIVPLGLGLVALGRARAVWRSRYERGEAITFALLASLMLFALLELGPLGAIRGAAKPAAPPPAAAPARPPQ